MLTFVFTLMSLLFGLTNGQTAYVNVLVVPGSAPTAAAATVPSATCDIVLSFFDGQSNLIKSSQVTISPGGSATLSLSSKEVKSNGKARVLVYGEVQLASDSDRSCQVNGSLEIVDPNGRIESLTALGGRGLIAAESAGTN